MNLPPRAAKAHHVVLVCAILFCLAKCQTSIVGGVAQYEGTPVQTNPVGIPTLIYNCAKMPSICNNVHEKGGVYRLATELDNGVDRGWKNRLVDPRGYVELNLDKDPGGRGSPSGKRIEARRDASCPTEVNNQWKDSHTCPETQPPQPPVVDSGLTVSTGHQGQLLYPNGPPPGRDTFKYQIADANGVDLGLRWSCDEWPPAMSVEGGAGANTYCAPIASACTAGHRKSEQDFQSSAHGTVKYKASEVGVLQGVWTVHFRTHFDDDEDAAASSVQWYFDDEHDWIYDSYRKRSVAARTLISHRIFANGSIVEFQREVPADHGNPKTRKRDLSMDPFDEPGVKITRRTLVLATVDDSALLIGRQDEVSCERPDYFDPQFDSEPSELVQSYIETAPGQTVQDGKKLRILTVGDSITVGHLSDQNGGDGNGYRRKLRDNLKNDVVFAGTETMGGTMEDNYFAAWSGQTIKYISDHVEPSLKQKPNLILLMAGTNDMHPDKTNVAKEGNDPVEAAGRLGNLIDQIFKTVPDATLLVALIVPTCDEGKVRLTKQFQSLIAYQVQRRRENGKHIMAVDLSTFPLSLMDKDCVHPSNEGYRALGDYWYDFITQIPGGWIKDPEGPDPDRPSGQNGGPDPDIPDPDWGENPIKATSKDKVASAAERAEDGDRTSCKSIPHWEYTGKIAQGLSRSGDFKYSVGWNDLKGVAEGIHRDKAYVRLVDMNGDGKADYVWIHPDTGTTICWLNNLPEPWSKAGTNDSIIASGAGRSDSVFLADMNGDGLADYLVVDPKNGRVKIWWNYGPDESWVNGWKFVEGGVIATGVPHANWQTLRFPDINGDHRADYVTVGVGGSLRLWLNMGHAGAQDPVFYHQGGIATGATDDIDKLVFADLDGDGRDDYLIWDNDAGLTGFLNKPTYKEGVPIYINQGPAKTIAAGLNTGYRNVRLADMNGDGKADYVVIGDEGSLHVWENTGSADTSMTIDGLRFADIDGDGIDDYVWLHPKTGAPTVFINKGPNSDDSLGWLWSPLNNGDPIASGVTRAEDVKFGDIDGDGLDDYLVLDPDTGELKVWLNKGPDSGRAEGWLWEGIGSTASGLGPGRNVRFADIDGDGFDDYIFLKPNGGTVIYRNTYGEEFHWHALPEADASGIGRAPDEIDFYDINGDGKADYIWLNPLDGSSTVWFNNYPNQPTWLEQPQIAGGVGVSGRSVKWAYLQDTGRASYVATDPDTGAISAWLNGCTDLGEKPRLNKHPCVSWKASFVYDLWNLKGDGFHVVMYENGKEVCDASGYHRLASDETEWTLTCKGSGITFEGSSHKGFFGDEYEDGWHYKNPERGVERYMRAALDERWCEEVNPNDPENKLKFRIKYETFHSRDKCGMELEPLIKKDPTSLC